MKTAKPINPIPRFNVRTVELRGVPIRCRTERIEWHDWRRAPPFAVNPRGRLIHRVRSVSTVVLEGRISHVHVYQLCNNGFNIKFQGVKDALANDPPKDRLLCVHCEAMAQRFRMPSADSLAGRHVHRGVLVPTQVCCLDDGNRTKDLNRLSK